MKIFSKLRLLSAFRREHLAFTRTLEDQDLVREIGYHQERGEPVTLKLLLLAGIASTATVQRRLARLQRLGVVHRHRSQHDGRLVVFTLERSIVRLYRRMWALTR
jgi:DNA-binding MarR family transcriptional regulator